MKTGASGRNCDAAAVMEGDNRLCVSLDQTEDLLCVNCIIVFYLINFSKHLLSVVQLFSCVCFIVTGDCLRDLMELCCGRVS